MILVDSSAWIEYDRKTGSPAHLRLHDLVPETSVLAVTEPVVAEVAMGAHTEDGEAILRRFLSRYRLLHFHSPGDFDAAISLYRRCRAQSDTPRGMVDCMIASVAIRNGVPLLAHDKDMARIASVTELRLDEASFRP